MGEQHGLKERVIRGVATKLTPIALSATLLLPACADNSSKKVQQPDSHRNTLEFVDPYFLNLTPSAEVDTNLVQSISRREALYKQDYLLDPDIREEHLRDSLKFFKLYSGVDIDPDEVLKSVVWNNDDKYKDEYLVSLTDFETGQISFFTQSFNFRQDAFPGWSPLSTLRQSFWAGIYKKEAYDKGPKEISRKDIQVTQRDSTYYLDRSYGFLRIYKDLKDSSKQIKDPYLESAFSNFLALLLEEKMGGRMISTDSFGAATGKKFLAMVRMSVLFREHPDFLKEFMKFHSESDVIGLNVFLAEKAGITGDEKAVVYGEKVVSSLMDLSANQFMEYLKLISSVKAFN